jgi:hypothetical protein
MQEENIESVQINFIIKQQYNMNDLFYNLPFDYFFEKIKNNQHFKYSRFNDGEITAMIGKRANASNCDGHQYFPEMSKMLNDVLLNYKKDENYILESFIYWYNLLPDVNSYLNHIKFVNKDLSFLKEDFIRITHEKNPELFIDLLNLLKEKKVVVVGPYYLKKLNNFFNFDYIDVPVKNCFLGLNKIIKDVDDCRKDENIVFLFSASMPTKIIIDYFKYDNKNTYIDWGSVWDTFFISPEYNFIRKRSSSSNEKYRLIYKDYLI